MNEYQLWLCIKFDTKYGPDEDKLRRLLEKALQLGLERLGPGEFLEELNVFPMPWPQIAEHIREQNKKPPECITEGP